MLHLGGSTGFFLSLYLQRFNVQKDRLEIKKQQKEEPCKQCPHPHPPAKKPQQTTTKQSTGSGDILNAIPAVRMLCDDVTGNVQFLIRMPYIMSCLKSNFMCTFMSSLN